MSDKDVVTLDRGNGTSCRVHSFGATVISWKCRNEEHIFVSSKAVFDNKTAIRGGIPVVFPHFGPWSCGPEHGFARITKWHLAHPPKKDDEGNVSATFTLKDNAETRKMWNYRFKLTYTLTLLEDALQMYFLVENTGTEEFVFHILLHTYFRVPDIRNVTVSSLKGATYIDKVKGGGAKAVETRDVVTIQENVDRVYIGKFGNLVGGQFGYLLQHEIGNVAGGRTILLQKCNLSDTVLWNPWKEKAAAMSDMGNEDYLKMICVEAGHVNSPTTLPPESIFIASQEFKVIHPR